MWTTLLVLSGVHAGAQRDGAADWVVLEGHEFSVLHHPEDASYAVRVRAIYEARGGAIASSMGLKTLSPLRAVVASSHEEFAELTNRGVPDWGVGCALPGQGLIILKSPRIVSYPLEMEAVAEHEMAHAAAGRVLRDMTVPRWFHEGVAQAVAGEWRMEASASLAAMAAAGALPTLAALADGFPEDRDEAAVAYAVSFRAVLYLMDEARIRDAGELVRAVHEEGEFEKALSTLVGMGEREFQAHFERHLSRRLSRGLLLRDGRVLFSGAAILVLVAFVVRGRRRRRLMRRWEDEEAVRSRRRPVGGTDSRWQ